MHKVHSSKNFYRQKTRDVSAQFQEFLQTKDRDVSAFQEFLQTIKDRDVSAQFQEFLQTKDRDVSAFQEFLQTIKDRCKCTVPRISTDKRQRPTCTVPRIPVECRNVEIPVYRQETETYNVHVSSQEQ